MSSLKFIDYMNISSLSAISFVNASLAYLNSTNGTNGSTASYPSGVNLTTANGSMLLEMASPPSAASALPALFSLNGTALDFGLGGVGAGPGGSYPAPNYSFPFHNFVQKEFIFDRTDHCSTQRCHYHATQHLLKCLPLAASAFGLSADGTALDFDSGSGAGPGGSYPAPNYSFPFHNFVQKEFIFDRTDVRVIFITLYSLVFCCCFFGNLLVILVVTMSRRLRSITNFFLANLAVADLCVGVFCVMQNLTIYLIESGFSG
ncbi:conserved hypothetical protein [Culex quinquefasciatus]|uniref:G-protein coupled receptors family 1 profile domain-containing protein n=1 Tax=Culex quinquefasciatus TaxID=7176 RepID=B0W4V6_CULQU|nr:conserved hypothetical protein [Culex quinquefasciatus]|eukprot:XP_001843740.1 conserved hypothetical protein [Culex quinquefasciatus]